MLMQHAGRWHASLFIYKQLSLSKISAFKNSHNGREEKKNFQVEQI